MNNDPIVIVSALRTAMGGFQGELASLRAPQLAAAVIKQAVAETNLPPELVEQVLLGNVLQAGIGQAPARQAAILAGLPYSAACTTVHKVCGSAMQATILAHDMIVAGSASVAISGGMESMSNAPYLLAKARGGMRLGHGQCLDHMFFDGLEDSYSDDTRGRLMGTFAEECAGQFGFSRAEQDEYAIRSLLAAQQAINNGYFKDEIVDITIASKKGQQIINIDEQPLKAQIDKIATLKPAFKKDGTVTAANSSSISDGAAALILMRQSQADKLAIKPLAKIIAHCVHAEKPANFPVAPIGAIKKCLEKSGWTSEQVDLFEINEAFAVVTMAAMQALALPLDKVNIHGGACALGHPIGASGARIIVTLLHALRRTGGKRGLASLCIGGGEATAMSFELM